MSDGSLPLPWFRLQGSASAGREGTRRAERADRLGNDIADQDGHGIVSGLADLVQKSNDAANFLKALGHDGRLMILCHLMHGPKSVTELENLLSARQAVVSQQLARLRLEGLVSARREGQAIFYSILDPKVSEVLVVLARLFCKPE